MDQFKGYIITNGKVPAEKFKNVTDFKTKDQVDSLPEYAGILEEGYMVVDVDDKVQSEVLLSIVKDKKLNTIVYRTSRGMHFHFKTTELTLTNKTNTFVACGLKVDMKLGSRNSYVLLKNDGKEREVIYQADKIDEIPVWLTPISYTFPFLKMEDGDGRNQSLFNYILTLQSNSFSKNEARETIRVIGKYVLEDKMEDSELDVILRDESFNKPIFYGGKQGTTFLFDKFAQFLVSEHNIIKINNQLHIYRDGIYEEGSYDIENQMIKHIPTLSHAQRTEVMRYLNILIRDNTKPSPAHLIAFNNGIYNLMEDKFEVFSDKYIITNKIPWDYNPNSYSELADKTMNKMACQDKEIRQLMNEAIGYTFYRRNEMRKSFMLTGGKANGKSTYLTMLQNLLGNGNYSSLDLGELSERFTTVELFGKLANIGDDVNDSFIKDTSIFKKLVSGDSVTVERKGADPFTMESYAKLLFSANTIPRMKDGTGAVTDRIIIIPFNATFSVKDKDFDPYIRYKLEDPEVMEYMINIGLEGLKNVLLNNAFTESNKVKDKMKEYEMENNPVKQFINESEEDEIVNQSTMGVYQDYTGFCHANGLQPVGRLNFTKTICDELSLVSRQQRINGKRLQIFIKE